MKKQIHATAIRSVSSKARKEFLTAIRRGHITTAREAAEMFGVSRVTVSNWVRKARAEGIGIVTNSKARACVPWRIAR